MVAHRPAGHAGLTRAVTVAVCCLLLTTALGGPALAATAAAHAGTDSHGIEDGSVEGPESMTLEDSDNGDSIVVDEALESATGTVEVVVRLEEATIPDDATETEAELLLEDHAEETQEPLLEYVSETPGIDVETEFWVTNAVLLEVDTDRVSLESLEEIGAIEAIHENFELSVPPTPASNGVDVSEAPPDGVDVATTNTPTTRGISQLNAPAVWDSYGTRGDGVRVAVLDTGVDASHPDIDLATDDPSDPTYPGGWAAFNSTGDRLEGVAPYDSGTHGTHVSGTVAGGSASGLQIGVAPDVELLHGLVLSETSGSFAQVVAGIEWALEKESDVINLSLGSTGRHGQLIDPVRNAQDSGAVVVAAIGNDGPETSSSPGNVYDAISVGAVYGNGELAPFSSGERVDRNEWRDPPESWPSNYTVPTVAAHGVAVLSTVPDGEYEAMPGTSMATPHVSGAIALMLSVELDATPEAVADALYETAWIPDGVNGQSTDGYYGHGIVDAKAATEALVASQSSPEATITETSETEPEPRDEPPFSHVVAGVVSVVVLAVSLGALLAARSLATDLDR